MKVIAINLIRCGLFLREGSLLTDGEDDGMDSDDGDLEEEMPEGENFGRGDAEEGESDMLSDDESAPASVVDAEELRDMHQRYWKLLREEESTGWQDPNVRKLLNPSLFVGRPPSVIYHNDWATGVPSFDESPLHEVEDEGAGEEIEGEQKPRPKKARSLTVKVLSEKPKSAQLWLFHKKLLTFKVRRATVYFFCVTLALFHGIWHRVSTLCVCVQPPTVVAMWTKVLRTQPPSRQSMIPGPHLCKKRRQSMIPGPHSSEKRRQPMFPGPHLSKKRR